jgi:glycosyltransferase involved in cell wall biosynthesis
MPVTMTVVVPTVGRPSLHRALQPVVGRVPVVVVDDRPDGPPLSIEGVTVLRSGGRGPAAARNLGWRQADSEWVAFLDDDVEPPGDWVSALAADLEAAGPDVGGVQGRITVPTSERPTDWERSTKGLETAVWATADLAYRRSALETVGGFDECFPRAYREDADLGLRVTAAGWHIVTGRRNVVHPVRPARWTQSIRSQRGNADDVRMRRKHGPDWRHRAQVPAGRRPWHLATTAALLAAAVPRWRRAALTTWAVLVGDFARRRVAPGPRTTREVATMLATSVAIPEAATGWWLLGWWRSR